MIRDNNELKKLMEVILNKNGVPEKFKNNISDDIKNRILKKIIRLTSRKNSEF